MKKKLLIIGIGAVVVFILAYVQGTFIIRDTPSLEKWVWAIGFLVEAFETLAGIVLAMLGVGISYLLRWLRSDQQQDELYNEALKELNKEFPGLRENE
jgi:hypothetical protein